MAHAAPVLTALAAVATVTGLSLAGPTWNGDLSTDAGETPDTGAQVTDDTKPVLARIEGTTGTLSPAGIPDFVDMYLIRICDPEGFVASLLPGEGGGAEFPTQLWLFKPGQPGEALGLLGNDDAKQGVPLSRLGSQSNDGSGAAIVDPGRYWLAISREDRDPVSPGGLLFDLPEGSDEISGPDGPGGDEPVGQWVGPVGQPGGLYVIALDGATFGGGPDLDCNCNGVLDRCDIFFGTSADENEDGIPDECACRSDLDGDGVVGFNDLLLLLANFGPCDDGTGCLGDLNCDGQIRFPDLVGLLAAWGPCSG